MTKRGAVDMQFNSFATGLVDGWVGSGAVYMYDLFRDVANVLIATYGLSGPTCR